MVDLADIAGEDIEATRTAEIENVLSNMEKKRVSNSKCEIYGEDIPIERQRAVPGCRYCIDCQNEIEKENR